MAARILLVDDDNDILHIASSILAQQHYEVMTAPGVLEALELLKTFPFDAIITDANMPHYSGFDLLKSLKADPRLKDIAVAMLTGRRERRDIERALQAGVDDYMVKPIDPLIFVKKVEALFVKKPAQVRAEYPLPQVNAFSKATIQMKIDILSISEMGLVLRTSCEFQSGEILDLQTAIFTDIGVETPFLKVMSSVRAGTSFETRVAFVGAADSTLQRVRAWIVRNTTRLAA